MNLRFTPPVLVLALSIGASARVVSKANVGTTFADRSTFLQKHDTEKFISRRRANSITPTMFNQETTTGRNFYNPDVGILQDKTHLRRFGSDNVPRFLQNEAAPLCGTNGTCPHDACVCRANQDVTSDQCAPVINSICNGYTDADGKDRNIDGCINDYQDYPGMHDYIKTGFCLMAKCMDEGGTHGSCYCQMYQYACQMFGDERPYSVRRR